MQLSEKHILDWNEAHIRDSNNVEHECLSFKDRSRFVELPCKIGTELFRIKRINGKPFITNTRLNVNNFWRIVIQGEFGKTVFLSCEEAEQALKARSEQP